MSLAAVKASLAQDRLYPSAFLLTPNRIFAIDRFSRSCLSEPYTHSAVAVTVEDSRAIKLGARGNVDVATDDGLMKGSPKGLSHCLPFLGSNCDGSLLAERSKTRGQPTNSSLLIVITLARLERKQFKYIVVHLLVQVGVSADFAQVGTALYTPRMPTIGT